MGMTACTGAVRRGSALYAEGRLVEAAEVFEHSESRLEEEDNPARAEYGLYRGLTLLGLGDEVGAKQWLRYAVRIDEKDPKALHEYDRALLARGWWDISHRHRIASGPRSPTPGDGAARRTPPASDAPARSDL